MFESALHVARNKKYDRFGGAMGQAVALASGRNLNNHSKGGNDKVATWNMLNKKNKMLWQNAGKSVCKNIEVEKLKKII